MSEHSRESQKLIDENKYKYQKASDLKRNDGEIRFTKDVDEDGMESINYEFTCPEDISLAKSMEIVDEIKEVKLELKELFQDEADINRLIGRLDLFWSKEVIGANREKWLALLMCLADKSEELADAIPCDERSEVLVKIKESLANKLESFEQHQSFTVEKMPEYRGYTAEIRRFRNGKYLFWVKDPGTDMTYCPNNINFAPYISMEECERGFRESIDGQLGKETEDETD